MKYTLSYLPNCITVFRLLLTAPIVWSLLEGYGTLALALLFVSGISDWMDGWLARRYEWRSEIGAFLDPMADKVLLISTFLTFGYLGKMPAWLASTAVARDLLIVLGISIYHWWIGPLRYRPIISSKVNTGLQITLVLLLLINENKWELSPLLLDLISYSVLVTSIVSFVQYAKIWVMKVSDHVKKY